MKLSSKLLIILGITIFLIPLLVTAYITTRNRVDAHVYSETLNKEAKDPNAKDVYLKSVKMNPFERVEILGDGARWIEVHLIGSDQYAVKAGKNDEIKMEVKKGVLRIDLLKTEQNFSNILYIFAPEVRNIKLTNVTVSDFFARQPYLRIEGDNIQDFSFNAETDIKSLDMDLKHARINSDYNRFPQKENGKSKWVSRFNMKLDSCDINVVGGNVDTLRIFAKESKLVFSKVKSNATLFDIHTVGNTYLGTDSLSIDEIKGTLSDNTRTDMPIHLLRKLLK